MDRVLDICPKVVAEIPTFGQCGARLGIRTVPLYVVGSGFTPALVRPQLHSRRLRLGRSIAHRSILNLTAERTDHGEHIR